MADYKKLIEELTSLNPYEKVGKLNYDKTGMQLRHGQYLYLTKYGLEQHTLETMNNPRGLREQGQIVSAFHEQYGISGLTEQDFISSDADIEIEQLLRYIEFPHHSHEFVECAYVLRGNCIHCIDESEVVQQEGSFIIVPVPVRHKLTAIDDAICLTIKIRLSLFMKMSIPHLPAMIYPLSFTCGEDPAIESMLCFLYEQQQNELPYRKELIQSYSFYNG